MHLFLPKEWIQKWTTKIFIVVLFCIFWFVHNIYNNNKYIIIYIFYIINSYYQTHYFDIKSTSN